MKKAIIPFVEVKKNQPQNERNDMTVFYFVDAKSFAKRQNISKIYCPMYSKLLERKNHSIRIFQKQRQKSSLLV